MTEKNIKPPKLWKFGGKFIKPIGMSLTRQQLEAIDEATSKRPKESQTNDQFEDEINWLIIRMADENIEALEQIESNDITATTSSASMRIFPPRSKGQPSILSPFIPSASSSSSSSSSSSFSSSLVPSLYHSMNPSSILATRHTSQSNDIAQILKETAEQIKNIPSWGESITQNMTPVEKEFL
jgi:hypothetical protein